MSGIPRTLSTHPSYLLLAGALLLAAGCEVAAPEAPTFTTQLAVPIGEERLDIAEVIADEENLVALPDGALGFRVTGDPDTVALDFDLAADVPARTVRSELGAFELAPAAPPEMDFTLGELYPASQPLHGQSLPVPAFTFDLASGGEDLADVASATVAGGEVTITLDNGLPVPISSAAPGPEQVVVTLVDPGDGRTVLSLPVDRELPPFSLTRLTADLAGVVLPGALAVNLDGGSPGSSGRFVTIDTQARLGVGVAFGALEVAAAEAVIGVQHVTTAFDVDLPADHGVLAAEFARGTLTVAMANELAIPCQAEVVWPDVFTPAGDTLRVALELAAQGARQAGVDFAGCTVRAPGGAPLTALHADVRVTSPGSGGRTVTVAAGQGVAADLAAGELDFAEVTGTLPALDAALDPVDEPIDLPDELDGVELQRARLVLAVTNTADITADADIVLTGTSAAGATAVLTVRRTLAAAGTTTIVLDETNSTLVDFLNILPTRVTLAGGVTAGGPGVVGTFRPGDRATVAWEIAAPVEVALTGSTLYGDPEDLGLDEDVRDLIRDHARGARAQLEILNHLPVGIEARLLFGVDTLTIAAAPLLAIGPVAVAAGAVDPLTGEVASARTSRPTIELTPAQTQVLATEGLHGELEVVLPTTDGEVVRVLTTDYVTARGLVRLELEVSE